MGWARFMRCGGDGVREHWLASNEMRDGRDDDDSLTVSTFQVVQPRLCDERWSKFRDNEEDYT